MGHTVNHERRIIPKQQGGPIDLEGTFDSVISELLKLSVIYGPKARLELFTEPYSDSDRQNLYVVVPEPETDAEMATRIADEEKYAAFDDARERAEFERLSAKFGKV